MLIRFFSGFIQMPLAGKSQIIKQSWRISLFPGLGRDGSNSRELRYTGKLNSAPSWFYNWMAIKYSFPHSGYSRKIGKCEGSTNK